MSIYKVIVAKFTETSMHIDLHIQGKGASKHIDAYM